jgi:hypothetical protein
MARALKKNPIPKTVDVPDLKVYKEVEKVKQQLSVYQRLKQFFNQFNIL